MKSRYLKSLLTAVSLSILFTGCPDSKTVVTKVESPDASGKSQKMNGVFYALPRTVVRVSVNLVRKDFEKGKYQKYAGFFFPDEELNADENKTRFSIVKADFETRGEPDPDSIYQVKIPGGRFETRSLLLELSEQGTPTKLEAVSKDESIDIATGAIKTAAGLAATAFALAGPPTNEFGLRLASPVPEADFLTGLSTEEKLFYASLPTQAEKDFYRTLSPTERQFYRSLSQGERDFYRTLTQEQAGFFKSLSQEERDYYRTQVQAGDRRDFSNAKEIARKIKQLQADRDDLVSKGAKNTTAPLPVETLKEMVTRTESLIETYKNAFFLGSVTKKEATVGPFEYRPPNLTEPLPAMTQPLFLFSPQRGVVDLLATNQGLQKPDKFFIEKVCPDGTNNCTEAQRQVSTADELNVTLEVLMGTTGASEAQFSSALAKAKLDKGGQRGFFYRVPAVVSARVNTSAAGQPTKEISRSQLAIAQLGTTASLPASTGGRRTSYTLALYESSGALKNFLMGSDAAIQKSNVDDIGSAAQSAVESQDKIKKLQREKDTLQLQKDIKTLKKEAETETGTETPPQR